MHTKYFAWPSQGRLNGNKTEKLNFLSRMYVTQVDCKIVNTHRLSSCVFPLQEGNQHLSDSHVYCNSEDTTGPPHTLDQYPLLADELPISYKHCGQQEYVTPHLPLHQWMSPGNYLSVIIH